ncbi:TRAP transporter substrate-binding protein DctP [Zhouia sp. PK063]|uniref:TRAP transporter substrate-binding protein DctP n=1 Tax=Zhouia sp. PK063 TaxID=3373602 RepID=UPI00378E651A
MIPLSLNAQKILVYSDHQPLEGMRTKFLNEVFFPAIERESHGKLKIEAHWNGELAIAYDAFAAVSTGNKVDMATVVPEYSAKELPIHQLFKSFPVGPFGKKQVAFFREVYKTIPAFTQELQQHQLTPIFLATGYPVGFFSKEPLKKGSDLQQQKWRSASFWHLDFLKNLKATPVRMHWGHEIYEALQEGTLDGIIVNVDSGYNLKVYEHAPQVLTSKQLWLGHLYIVTIHTSTWNSISAEDKAAIQRAANYAYKKLGSIMNTSFKLQMKQLKQLGATVTYMTPKEVKNFEVQTKYKTVQEHWVKEQNKLGIQNLEDTLLKLRTLVAKFK